MSLFSPCKNCEERQLKCHQNCEKYKDFVKCRIEYSRSKRANKIQMIETPRYDKIRGQK